MEKINLKDVTIIECQLQKFYIYPVYPRNSKLYSDKGFANIDNGSTGETHWTCFKVKDKKSFYFDSFGGAPDKFLLNQLPEPIICHNYKIQGIYSKLGGSYCLYFFNLVERLNYYDTIPKLRFETFYLFSVLDIILSLYSYKYNDKYDVIRICIVVIKHILNMPINVFGNSSNISDKIDTICLFKNLI